MKVLRILFLLLICSEEVSSAIYETSDSLRVVDLLRKGAQQPADCNIPLFYAHSLEGCPYEASTLEVGDTEQLVVNLRRFDCTTLVETIIALSLTTYQNSCCWGDFLHWLQKIRYQNGEMEGYDSRNHYFSQWISSNQALGLVIEQPADSSNCIFPFTQFTKIGLHFMSNHPEVYKRLKNNSTMCKRIRCMEIAFSGRTVSYIPNENLGLNQSDMKYVQDGDIIAVVSKKDGLDIAHVGFAQWCKDGKLHLLNASSLHKKVILESKPLQQYISSQPNQLGIRVVSLLH